MSAARPMTLSATETVQTLRALVRWIHPGIVHVHPQYNNDGRVSNLVGFTSDHDTVVVPVLNTDKWRAVEHALRNAWIDTPACIDLVTGTVTPAAKT